MNILPRHGKDTFENVINFQIQLQKMRFYEISLAQKIQFHQPLTTICMCVCAMQIAFYATLSQAHEPKKKLFQYKIRNFSTSTKNWL